jgi:uncharacterized protein (TIGR02231 family)
VINYEAPFTSKVICTEIVAVTVYTDQALVTRRGKTELSGEEQKLIIENIPITLDTETVRVGGRGRVAVKVGNVNIAREYATEPVEARTAQITAHIEQLESEQSYLQAQLDGLALQTRFIEGLREKTEEPFAQSISRKNLNLSETLDFINFLGSQYTEYGIATRECENRKQEIDKELQVLKQQLKRIQTPQPKESFKLTIDIEPAGAGEFELEVTYVVSRAAWTPLYDVRVNTTNKTLLLSYIAEVTQNTGEDWNHVALTLSTAKPGLGTLPPKLEPWYVGIRETPPARILSMSLKENAKRIRQSAYNLEFDEENNEDEYNVAQQEVYVEAEIEKAEVSKEGSVVSFKLNNGGNIPNDGAPHKAIIFNDDFPFDFSYVAMPRLVSFAYLQTIVKNPTDGATLLPGKINIFRDNVFVGSAQLENVAPGQEFNINLGIDEGIKIERDLVERHVDKKLISSNRKITYAYRLIVTNLLNQEANLKLSEQIPKSKHEQIKIYLNRTNPQIQLGEMGILEWELKMAPQSKQEIYYQFIVEYPPQLDVVGLL